MNKTSCITHATEKPYGTLQLDYMQLCDDLGQVAIMQSLETAPPDEWIPLTFEDFKPTFVILSLDRWDFNQALKDLIARGHIIKHQQGDVYQINALAVQEALDEQQAASLDA